MLLKKSSMPCVAIFTSDMYPFADDDPPEAPPPTGQAMCKHLMKEAQKRCATYTPDNDSPGQDEATYFFHLNLGTNTYMITAMWAPLSHPDEECWCMQFTLVVGCLAGLFGRRELDTDIEPIVSIFKTILQDAERFQNVRWLSMAEFYQRY